MIEKLRWLFVCMWNGCDFRWQSNEQRQYYTGLTGPRPWNWQVVGHYKCARCAGWRIGAARHEQKSREVKPDDADAAIAHIDREFNSGLQSSRRLDEARARFNSQSG